MLRSFARTAARLTGIGAAIGGLAGAFLSLRGTIRGLREAFDFGSQMDDFSARTGVAVGELTMLGEAFRQAGIDAGKVPDTIQRLQRRIVQASEGSQSAVDSFARLGLSMTDLRGQTAGQQFESIAGALGRIEDPAMRSAAAMDIFGRAGAELVTLFRDPEAMAKAAQTLGQQADILERNAGAFDRISDLLGGASVKMRGFFIAMGERLAPILLDLLEKMDKLDLSELGQKIGDLAIMIGEAFASGELTQLIFLGLRAGFEQLIDWISGVLGPAISDALTMAADGLLNALDQVRAFVFKDHLGASQADLERFARTRDRRAARRDGPTTDARDEFSSALEEFRQRFAETQQRSQDRVEQMQAERPPAPTFVPPGEDDDADDMGQQTQGFMAQLMTTFRRIGGEATDPSQRQMLTLQQRQARSLDEVAANTRQTNAAINNLSLAATFQ